MAFKSAPPRNVAAAARVPNRGVVKQASNTLPKKFYVNAAAAGVACLIAVLAVRGVTVKDDTPPCSERLGNGTLFGLLGTNGRPISTTDLQSRLGGRDWGLVENLKLVSIDDSPAPVAMRIGLPRTAAVEGAVPASGMGFTWLLPKAETARAACLTYHVRLPDGFDFGAGGRLPGLYGAETTDAPTTGRGEGFLVRSGWGAEGIAQLRASGADPSKGMLVPLDPDRLQLQAGKWTTIEQEVVLNRPGESDGALRVWVDGKLRYENDRIAIRKNDKQRFRGVLADVHYGESGQAWQAVPKATSIEITPFEVRWQ